MRKKASSPKLTLTRHRSIFSYTILTVYLSYFLVLSDMLMPVCSGILPPQGIVSRGLHLIRVGKSAQSFPSSRAHPLGPLASRARPQSVSPSLLALASS